MFCERIWLLCFCGTSSLESCWNKWGWLNSWNILSFPNSLCLKHVVHTNLPNMQVLNKRSSHFILNNMQLIFLFLALCCFYCIHVPSWFESQNAWINLPKRVTGTRASRIWQVVARSLCRIEKFLSLNLLFLQMTLFL